MRKAPASVLCLAALPLLGCTGDYAARQATAVAPAPPIDAAPHYTAPSRVYAATTAAPAAILVFLPGADAVAQDPALWEAQGIDVVMPQPADIYRMLADQEAAVARLVASAQAVASAPIWLVGPSQVIEATMPQLGNGVSGAVVTSVASPAVSCSESFSYYDPGTGAPPKIQVSRSGDCGPGFSGTTAHEPTIVQPPPARRPNAPRIIEAANISKNLPPATRVRRLAQLIKGEPPG